MSRRTKTLLPTTKNLLVPEVTLGQHPEDSGQQGTPSEVLQQGSS